MLPIQSPAAFAFRKVRERRVWNLTGPHELKQPLLFLIIESEPDLLLIDQAITLVLADDERVEDGVLTLQVPAITNSSIS
jgi:hypothetical protein